VILSPANAPEPSFSKRHLNPLIPLELINEKVFSAGSDNFIAGWNFNEKAIFSGIQTNSGFTTKSYILSDHN